MILEGHPSFETAREGVSLYFTSVTDRVTESEVVDWVTSHRPELSEESIKKALSDFITEGRLRNNTFFERVYPPSS